MGQWNGNVYVGDAGDELAIGTDANESLYGAGGNDTLNGAGGNDFVAGGDGDDVLSAGLGNDNVVAGDGRDWVSVALLGHDRILLGNTADTLDLFYAADAPKFATASYSGDGGFDTLSLTSADHAVAFDGFTLRIDGDIVGKARAFEFLNVAGGGQTDVVTGFALGDFLDLRGGNDFANGAAGDDTIDGGLGANRLAGGDGDDALAFAYDLLADTVAGGDGLDSLQVTGEAAAAIVISGNLASSAKMFLGGKQIATLSGIESLTLATSDGNDRLVGGSGDDSFSGAAGRDFFATGAGDDTVRSTLDLGSDTVDLSVGNDLYAASFAGAADIAMAITQFSTTFRFAGALAATVTGAERYDIAGGAGDDTLNGGALADTLSGGAGANSVFGGAGDDLFVLLADATTDSLRGGGGFDRLQVLSNGQAALVTQLTGPGFYDVRIGGAVRIDASGIEAVNVAGGTAADILVGMVGDDNLAGNGGNDSIDGNVGNDNLSGGAGNDSMLGGAGDDRIAGDSGSDRLIGNVGCDSFTFTDLTANSIDTVVDFFAEDSIAVAASAFAGLSPNGSVTLIGGADPTPPPGSVAPVFLYDTDTGNLAFDRDGAGSLAAQIFATIRTGGGNRIASLDQDQIVVI